MPSVSEKSLRAELETVKGQVAVLRKGGQVSPEVDAVLRTLLSLLALLVAVLLEKTTRKTSRNSSIPPSQMDEPDATRRARPNRKPAQPNDLTSPNLQHVTIEETLTVEDCDKCGFDLADVAALDREVRVEHDIVFKVIERRVAAELKQCPNCEALSKAAFPASLPGPLQYGSGLQAFIIHLLVAHMLSLRRTVGLVKAISGLRLSEATCLGYIRRLQQALQAWETAAGAHLLAAPALHADETGLRVERKNHWLHILTDGTLTLKFLHRQRGKAAIEAAGLIPRFRGTLVHDCLAAYLSYEKCRHQLCGAHLLRELTFVIDSNNYRWARLLKALLQEACRQVNRSQDKVLSAAACEALRERYRTILTQAAEELPAIPARRKGQRGRIAKSDAHNLHERLVQHEASVLRFLHDPDVSFTNNAGERGLRMAKVKVKVSGCFRTKTYGEAYARISSYLQSMSALGYNPLIAIQIALDGRAVDTLTRHYGATPTPDQDA